MNSTRVNTQAIADAKKVLTGKDGAFFNAKGKLLATVTEYTSKLSVSNSKYQPLGDPQEHEIFTSFGQTLGFKQVVIEDDEFIEYLLKMSKTGEMPCINFQGTLRGRNGSEQRYVYNDCVPSGDIDLQNITVGDVISRQWNWFVNGDINMQGKLKA